MKWTQEELEKLYQQVNEKAKTDEEFRKEITANPKAALEKAAGRPLPDDFSLKMIESDSGYAAAYVVPDFVQGELDSENLEQVTGGVFLIANIELCATLGVGDPCGAYADRAGSFNPQYFEGCADRGPTGKDQ